MGHLNDHHIDCNCRQICSNGSNVADNLNLMILYPPTPTHYHSNNRFNPIAINIAILQSIHYHYSISTLSKVPSDHYPIHLIIHHTLNITPGKTPFPFHLSSSHEIFLSPVCQTIITFILIWMTLVLLILSFRFLTKEIKCPYFRYHSFPALVIHVIDFSSKSKVFY